MISLVRSATGKGEGRQRATAASGTGSVGVGAVLSLVQAEKARSPAMATHGRAAHNSFPPGTIQPRLASAEFPRGQRDEID